MYNPPVENGNASYRSWMHLDGSAVAAITGAEGSDSIAFQDRKYAILTYQTNTVPITLSGVSVSIDLSPLTAQMAVLIANQDNILGETANYIISVSGITSGFTYVCKATVGSNPISAVWQAKRVSTVGNVTQISWADGNTNYDNIAVSADVLSYI